MSIVEGNSASIVAATEVSATSPERRQLTVMFCDLVGPTALSARLDPEDLRADRRLRKTKVTKA
jgi:class 3 adenylate cyclase